MSEVLHGAESMEFQGSFGLEERVVYGTECSTEEPVGAVRHISILPVGSSDEKPRSVSIVNFIKTRNSPKMDTSLSESASTKDECTVDSDPELEDSAEEKVIYETEILHPAFKPSECTPPSKRRQTKNIKGRVPREILQQLSQMFKNDSENPPKEELSMTNFSANRSPDVATDNGSSSVPGTSRETKVNINFLGKLLSPAKNGTEEPNFAPKRVSAVDDAGTALLEESSSIKVEDACLNYVKVLAFMDKHLEKIKSTYRIVVGQQDPEGSPEYLEKIESPYTMAALAAYIVATHLGEVMSASKAVPFSHETFNENIRSTTHMGWKVVAIADVIHDEMKQCLEHLLNQEISDEVNLLENLQKTIPFLQKIKDDMTNANNKLSSSKPGAPVFFGPRQRNFMENCGFDCTWKIWLIFILIIASLVALLFMLLLLLGHFSNDDVSESFANLTASPLI